ncbi:MAG: 2-amino-4-hydroxy-6-hydroxymethyldihydropteridine diphosphokinase [Sedimentibacter saalensis]|jgi:2-amino-4-hydroxy-6-hydroxymethyldihydropteridine diphosphokinase|uniref:2-amino-4-hydroxy-6-hydroxymethyldihydropteridine diphosphokinase n=1 Tax=Sedimentibacter saalensis TaxID=130788 RepID=A0A562JEY0_9FIRM|nr:2-amino-4-hydroxy-6-hydroxymethyldihydropteridine diphosphokinase [Sedimentibacter saalensis]MEA5096683.1 2-amino-4-hydroxy-6-hydroxymethyldihydropteridine diphosphokinase [Sedimentibacter saalensis]TWH81613.1 2-amino-4-hydroxy-6-hydroxymethyldihydropteridine diphosphokinase [Sedimentibacter saalensis]
MSKIYLSLGTNLGNKKENLTYAVQLLSEKIDILKTSSFYETEPVGYKDQPWFMNIVVEGTTHLSPEDLLVFTQSIEQAMKRVKTIVNGPRIIDVDILLYESVKINTETLIIPHPRMTERAFVMYPLFEISPDLIIDGKSLKNMMESFKGEEIKRLDV